MKYTARTYMVPAVLLVFLAFFFSGCASGKPAVPDSASPGGMNAAEDINGDFPEAVYIKTRTQTFDTYHYYILRDGLIWYKSTDTEQEPKEWVLFMDTGLPHNVRARNFNKPRTIAEISADADELVALSDTGGFYRFCFDETVAHESLVWLDRQGWPKSEQLFFDSRTANNRAWAMGKRNMQVLYYEDPFGNQHHNGVQEIATTYVLLEDGQEISYGDTGLPSDFSRNYIGPERGKFRAVSLSASASTLFLINEAGEMYTRMADFDIIGCDPMFFKYTYIPYTSDLPGTNYFSNLNEWGLPSEDWRVQPPIPLSDKAALTRHITILQNGQGNAARELRVAGYNEAGKTGYWTKAIFDDSWEFREVPLYFTEGAVLTETGVPGGAQRGESLDKKYSGYRWNGSEKEAGWQYEIPDFNILEGSCDFLITWQDETCTLTLHPLELWTYLKRDYLPGRTGSPKMFFVTLDIPDQAFDGLSEEFARSLKEKYTPYDKVLFHYMMAASGRYIFIRDTADIVSVVFMTDGTISDSLPDFRRTWYVDNYEEVRLYDSPELVFSHASVVTEDDYEELTAKIERNKALAEEIKKQISELEKSLAVAFGFNATYIPLDYIARFSLLNFVDVPKIRTITRFGETIVLANSAYTDINSNTRIWVDKKIQELLKIRIDCYTDMAKQFSRGRQDVPVPAWFSDTVSEYWQIAGLPDRIEGSFFGPSAEKISGTIPAVLTFTPSETDQEFFGWYLTIDSAPSFSIFVDAGKSPKTIYARRGKSPEKKQVIIECTLYINSDINTVKENEVIEYSLIPFLKLNTEGIDVRIKFDGTVFEIAEYPPGHSNTVIFRGTAVQE
ncbi:hypothetical protein K7I13_15190 [Brucepastera parasyntrophica]|uniref:hypothetical protein n=1 Tax=Brucepastera parasyntrophica TaxID=2880008 RepID=UPI00210A75C7|nr:hypothetical protein [Brucepastera parasyntrophica]ULQ59771.1 hypothetical protein K7I13_15190 [Brucepastera parasyntrophica]